MDYTEIKQQRYEEVKSGIDEKISQGYLPNIKAMEKQVLALKRRIKVLYNGGALFADTLEKAEQTNKAIAKLEGEMAAYKVFIDIYYSNLKK